MTGKGMAGSRFERRLARNRLTIVGAGRAGSFGALVAGMLGLSRLRVYDPDRLEPERNLSTQFYRAADVEARRVKVEALRDLIGELLPWVQVTTRAEAFEGRRNQATDPVVLLAVDTMTARKRCFRALARRRHLALLLDIRLGGPVLRLFTARAPEDLLWYRTTLHPDEETWGAACADSAEPHVAVAAAALAAGSFMAHLRESDSFPRMVALDMESAAFVVEPGEARPGRGRGSE